jgi:type I restriction enzyme, R subunit
MLSGFIESDAEEAALGWLETLGYTVRHGPEIAYNVDGGERSDPGYHDTILQNRLHRALTRLNPGLPTPAVFDAYRKLLRVEAPNLLARNRALHCTACSSTGSMSNTPGRTGRLAARRRR